MNEIDKNTNLPTDLRKNPEIGNVINNNSELFGVLQDDKTDDNIKLRAYLQLEKFLLDDSNREIFQRWFKEKHPNAYKYYVDWNSEREEDEQKVKKVSRDLSDKSFVRALLSMEPIGTFIRFLRTQNYITLFCMFLSGCLVSFYLYVSVGIISDKNMTISKLQLQVKQLRETELNDVVKRSMDDVKEYITDHHGWWYEKLAKDIRRYINESAKKNDNKNPVKFI